MTEIFPLFSFKEALRLADDARTKKHILLGNGFSQGADDKFKYGSLYLQAKRNGLPKQVEALFDRYGTTNFEEVLRHLHEGHWLARHYQLTKSNPKLDMEKDYEKVKDALVNAIATAHPSSRAAVPEPKLIACAGFLAQFNNVFTTNYDLLLYWASLAKPPILFKDGFWKKDENPNYLVFDTVPKSLETNERFIYFLHGALHISTAGGDVRKFVWGKENPPLIDQIREALSDDRFPLVVSEGDPEQKKERIESSSYLSACRDNFQKIHGSLFIFGSQLGTEDTHILRWIAGNRGLDRLFVGIFGDPDASDKQEMISRIQKQVDERKVSFYDSSSADVWTVPHPREEAQAIKS